MRTKLLAAWAPRAGPTHVRQSGGQVLRDMYSRAYGQRYLSNQNWKGISSLTADVPHYHSILRNPTPTSYHSFPRSAITERIRLLSTTRRVHDAKLERTEAAKQDDSKTVDRDEHDDSLHEFRLSEKAAQAAQINLSAKLGRDIKGNVTKPGWQEIWRLLQIARPEAKWLGLAFCCLLVSSAITMSIPFSIGKIIDVATKGSGEEANQLFGLSVPMFYTTLAGVLIIGAAANYGRIIILRIVGERVVARQRSKLFRRTFIQDAEFFDANRVGDLISRLSSDTLIVGKSITQNLSDGLRAAVSGAAGFAAMAYVSLKLSSVLALLLPPIGIAAFFYGRAIRNLSRKIQKNLGTLTKIAEERLGNVKTSQSFAGEVLEVHRYNTQVRKIFDLGKRESIISATFFSSVGGTALTVSVPEDVLMPF
jgi:putative ABC transport system ATP-binding protein